MQRIKRAFNVQLKNLFLIIKNLLFPVHCSSCKKVLKLKSAPPYLCQKCLSTLELIKAKKCISCGKSTDLLPKEIICHTCLTDKAFPFDEFIAAMPFDGVGKRMVHNLKFFATPSSAKTIGELIYIKLKAYDKLDKIDAFIPAPISTKRRYHRIYNQSELICRYLSVRTGIPTVKALKKIRHTPAQSSLPYKERLNNLNGAFAVRKDVTIPENVAFIDDVYTTGTTAKTCCMELKKLHPKNIYVVCGCITTYE